MDNERETLRRAILEAALLHIPFTGWSASALQAGAQDAGLDRLEAKRAFPGGGEEALAFFISGLDRRMLEALADRNLAALRVRERIALCVRTRLELMEPYREAVRRAVGKSCLPPGNLQAMRRLWGTTDLMWRAAGDESTDFNWYTKRGLLGKVYASTLLCWLQDDSEGRKETWEFLDRRIEDVMRFGKMTAQGREKLAGLGALATDTMRKFVRR